MKENKLSIIEIERILINMKCIDKEHNFIKILSNNHSWDGSAQVVKWCENCGCIKVDLEYDTKAITQRIRFPKILKETI